MGSWQLLMTLPYQEHQVAEQLRRRRCRFLLPLFVSSVESESEREVLFPRYLLVYLEKNAQGNQDWAAIRLMSGVSTWVRIPYQSGCDKGIPVRLVEWLWERSNRITSVVPEDCCRFSGLGRVWEVDQGVERTIMFFQFLVASSVSNAGVLSVD